MINKYIVTLSALLLSLSPVLYGCAAAPLPRMFITNPNKEALIKKIILYNEFSLILEEPNEELVSLVKLIQKPRASLLKELNTAVYYHLASNKKLINKQIKETEQCKSSLQKNTPKDLKNNNTIFTNPLKELDKKLSTLNTEIDKFESPTNFTPEDDLLITNLTRAIYCLSFSEEQISEIQKLGKSIVPILHPDKKKVHESSKLSSEITTYLMNNECGDTINNLLHETEKLFSNPIERLIEKQVYRIEINRLTQEAAEVIGYTIGNKLISKIIPDKETEKELSKQFIMMARVNELKSEEALIYSLKQLH